MRFYILFLTFTFIMDAHQGRLDSHGGHTNESTGKYHYHTDQKGTNANPFHSPIRIQILKYGYPHAWGQTFSSIERCEAERKMLIRQNKGSDLSYVCAIK